MRSKTWPVTALLLAACAVRTLGLGRDGLWYDEAYTAMFARLPALDVITGAARLELNLPLHYLLLKLWGIFGGQSEFALRLPSVFAGILTVALTSALISPHRRRIAAIALAAAWPVAIDLSQELRMYALAICLSTASVALLLHAMRRDVRSRWMAWAVVCIAAFSAHVLAAFVFAAQLPVLLHWWWPRRKTSKSPLAAALAAGAAIALCTIGLAALHQSYGTTFTTRLDPATTLLHSIAALALPSLQPPQWIAAAAAVVGLLIAAAFTSRSGLAPAFISATTLLLIAVFCTLTGKFAARYVAFAQPVLLAAACGATIPKRFAPIALGAMLTLCTIGATALHQMPVYANTDFKGAIAFLRSETNADEALLIVSGHAAPAVAYYWPDTPHTRWNALPADAVLDVRNTIDYALAAPALNHALALRRGAWLLLWQDDVADPAFTTQTLLRRSSTLNSHDREVLRFHGLRLLHYTFQHPWQPLPEAIPTMTSAITPHGPDVGLQSIGCHLFETPHLHAGALEIGCFWRIAPGSNAPFDVQISLRLRNAHGTVLSQVDQPLAPFGLPSLAYDKTILTFYTAQIPADAAPGSYSIAVIPYLSTGEITPLVETHFALNP